MRTRFAVLLFPESEIICCDISQKALQVTTFKTVQEMARRLVALKPSRGLLAELGGTTIYSSQYSVLEYWDFLFSSHIKKENGYD